MRARVRGTGALLLVLVTLGCDQATKHVAVLALKGSAPRSFLHDTLRLQYAENPGAFLSLGAGWPEPLRFGLFALGNALLLALLALTLLRSRGLRTPELLGFTLLLAGGASNLIDRLRGGGAVVDFLNLGVGPLRTGIFNVADLAITAGACALLLAALWPRSPARGLASRAVSESAPGAGQEATCRASQPR
jgi:signal peptidase II